jgi:N-acetyltransferase
MEYRPSVADDKKLHNKFHSRNVDGIPVNNLGTLLRIMDDEGVYKEETIVPLGRDKQRSAATKKLIHAALEVVETELGGVGIGAEELWSQVQEPRLGEGNSSGEATLHDRYKTFLFLRKDKILGVCLAERIFEARAVLPNPTKSEQADSPTNTTTDPAIMTEEAAQSATLGISRIWVSKCARGQGIAEQLLRFTAKRFIYRVNIPREQIAFSQPTMSGARLARRFFGKESGWLVYAG